MFLLSSFLLKPIYSRKLKNNDWVIYAANSTPLVVDENTADVLTRKDKILETYDADFFNVLDECGYFMKSSSTPLYVPVEETNLAWKMLKYSLIIIGAIALTVILLLTPVIGLPRGDKLFSSDVLWWKEIIFILIFSISTTLIHELLHMLFAKTFTFYRGGLQVSITKATAAVSMSHIWIWSTVSRVAALSAGIIGDLILLASLSCLRIYHDNWIVVSGSIILWVRILWQFRFHRKSDGQLLAMTILDNPLIAVDEKNSHHKQNKDSKIWEKLRILGYLVEFFLLIFWMIPFILSALRVV